MTRKTGFKITRTRFWIVTLALLLPGISIADDIEIFSHQEVVQPNILFSLDMSGSMDETAPGNNPGGLSKKEVLRQTLSDLLGSDLTGMNIGLQDFAGYLANVRLPVKPVETNAASVFTGQTYTAGGTTKTVPAFPDMPWASFVNQTAQGLSTRTRTPMMGSYLEAAHYMRGDPVDFGNKAPLSGSVLNNYASHPSTYTPQNAWQYGSTGSNVNQTCTRSWWYDDPANPPTGTPDEDTCPAGATLSCGAQQYYSGGTYDCNCDYVCTQWDGTGSECLVSEAQNCQSCTYDGGWYQNCDYTDDTYGWIKTTDPKYVSPISEACQENFIVLMTDGVPTKDDSRDDINAFTGDASCPTDESQMASKLATWKDDNGDPWFTDGSGNTLSTDTVKYGACGPALAKFMAEQDQCADGNSHCSITDTDDVDQSIKTYTIGFDLSALPEAKRYLELLAHEGDGKFYAADDAAGLTAAFKSAISDILARGSTFSAPAVSARTGPFQHDQWVFLPMFETAISPRWPGNVKKYEYDDGKFYDPDGDEVIDDQTGEFNSNVHDFWNAGATEDGNDIAAGGAASNLDDPRTVYTETSDGKNIVAFDSAGITESDFCGGTSHHHATCSEPIDLEALKTFTKGYESDGTPRKFVGDPLHSRLVTVNYAGDRQALYFTTNEGYLHSIDTDNGEENYAFIPRDLLKNQKTFYDNSDLVVNGTAVEHVYGLDGQMLIWHKDTNGNNVVDDNEDTFLIVGMRRGGRNYYVLDISDPDQPKMKFKIEGGLGDFTHLGQTWSPPKIIKIPDQGTEKYVLLFGGGYDDHQDFDDKAGNDGVRESDSMGNAVFIVGLYGSEAGKVLKEFSWADTGGSKMLYGIPGSIGVADASADGMVDRLYFSDTGGQVWRADLDKDDVSNSTVKRLADLNDGTTAGNRRFYSEPSVAVSTVAGQSYFHVSLGSGFRAHPLNKTVQDRFYSLVDDGSGTLISDSDLYNATANDIGKNSSKSALTEIYKDNNGDGYPDKKGWYINLDPTEKVLDSALTLNYEIVFTSYVPPADVSQDVCTAGPSGNGYTYAVSLLDATPAAEFLVSGNISSPNAERRKQNSLPGIVGEPVVMLTPEGTEVLTGREVVRDSKGEPIVSQEDYREEFWMDAAKQGNNP